MINNNTDYDFRIIFLSCNVEPDKQSKNRNYLLHALKLTISSLEYLRSHATRKKIKTSIVRAQ